MYNYVEVNSVSVSHDIFEDIMKFDFNTLKSKDFNFSICPFYVVISDRVFKFNKIIDLKVTNKLKKDSTHLSIQIKSNRNNFEVIKLRTFKIKKILYELSQEKNNQR